MEDKVCIKGRCPGAWQPMASGDGLIVRVRPRHAQLSRCQVEALCEAAERWGSGVIDLTNRANLQLRGVREVAWQPLIEALAQADLVDEAPSLEARRNLLVAPDWLPGDDTHQSTTALLNQLAELPELPAKVGFAVDAGERPVLMADSADFRIERAVSGQLLVRADGRQRGTPVQSAADAAALTVRLAHWFVESGGPLVGRMRRHESPLPPWAPASVSPAKSRPPLALGNHPLGAVYGLRFGQVDTATLRRLMSTGGIENVRVTPWRRLLVTGVKARPLDGLLLDNQAPELRVDACPGLPGCEQATVSTRPLATQLAGATAGSLHVSACPKGCARRLPADVCVVGREGRYDLVFRGGADEEPCLTGLTESQVRHYFGVE
ncbi:hypothetical protein [Marinimicrobium locisalis]|uniref:hypothetical protein n=1 Tax=Marinimicrobium locisalis TaxID=546022 RepID=UPI0032216C87